jgi:hypothetical protein
LKERIIASQPKVAESKPQVVIGNEVHENADDLNYELLQKMSPIADVSEQPKSIQSGQANIEVAGCGNDGDKEELI